MSEFSNSKMWSMREDRFIEARMRELPERKIDTEADIVATILTQIRDRRFNDLHYLVLTSNKARKVLETNAEISEKYEQAIGDVLRDKDLLMAANLISRRGDVQNRDVATLQAVALPSFEFALATGQFREAAIFYSAIQDSLPAPCLVPFTTMLEDRVVSSLTASNTRTVNSLFESFRADSIVSLEKVKQAAEGYAVRAFYGGNREYAVWAMRSFSLDQEHLKQQTLEQFRHDFNEKPHQKLFAVARAIARSFGPFNASDLKTMATEIAIAALKSDSIEDVAAAVLNAHDFVISFSLKHDALQSAVASAVLRVGAAKQNTEYIGVVREAFNLTQGRLNEAACLEFKAAVADGNLKTALWINKHEFDLGAVKIDPENRANAADLVAQSLNEREYKFAERLAKMANLSAKDFATPASRTGFDRFLLDDHFCGCSECVSGRKWWVRLAGYQDLSPDQIVVKQLEAAFQREDVNTATLLARKLKAPVSQYGQGELSLQATTLILSLIESNHFAAARNLKKSFNLEDKVFRSNDLERECEARISIYLQAGRIDAAVALQEISGINSNRVAKLAQNNAEQALKDGSLETLATLIGKFPVIIAPMKAEILRGLPAAIRDRGWPRGDTVEKIKTECQIRDRYFRFGSAQALGYQALEQSLRRGDVESAVAIRKQFALKIDRVDPELIADGLEVRLQRDWDTDAREFLRTFSIAPEAAQNDVELRHIARNALREAVLANDLEGTTIIQRNFRFTPEDMGEEIWQDIAQVINKHRSQGGRSMVQALGFTSDVPLAPLIHNLSPFYQSLIQGVGLRTLADLFRFVPDNQEYCNHLARQKDSKCVLTPEVYKLLRNPKSTSSSGLPLTLIEADTLIRAGYDFGRIGNDPRAIFVALIKTYCREDSRLTELDAIALDFEYERILEYMYRPTGVPIEKRGDCIRAIKQLADLTKKSIKDLSHTILDQVQRDGSTYDRHTPQNELAVIVFGTKFDLESVKAKAADFQDLEMLQQLVAYFSDGHSPFDSWESLKRFRKLDQALKDPEFLNNLRVTQAQDPALYNYICTLYFHSTSRVSSTAIRRLYMDVDTFMALEDQHTHPELHDAIKPFRFLNGNIPQLDLRGRELRDALVDGTLDQLQAFVPLQITYRLPRSGTVYATVHEAFLAAVGQRSLNRQGLAQSGGKVFKSVKDLLSAANILIQDFIEGKVVVTDAALQAKLMEAIYDKQAGIKEDWFTVTATIHPKSDPHAIIVGDDTACCMPFGEGKTNVYTFDPNIMMFTVQYEKGDGAFRTIAQSVLTRDVEVHQSFGRILQDMKQERTDMAGVLMEPPSMQGPFYLTCDNLQMAPNYASSEQFQELTRRVYKDFFRAYMDRFAQASALEPSYVDIGQGSSSGLTPLPLAPNTRMPVSSPIGYCDRNDEQVKRLVLDSAPLNLYRTEVIQDDSGNRTSCNATSVMGVSPLELTDTIGAAYLQGLVYQGDRKQVYGIQKMKTVLNALSINNAFKERPSFSFKYVDKEGVMGAYIIAYEGSTLGGPIVYVNDFVSTAAKSLGGVQVFNAFVSSYLKTYDGGPLPTIVVNVHGSQGFLILNSCLRRAEREYGFHFELTELPQSPLPKSTSKTLQVRVRQIDDKRVQERRLS